MFSFDMQDGFYALGIAPSDRNFFTVNIRGTLYRLGARILPYVDDFLLFASSEPEALELCQRVADLLDSLGLPRNPTKGLWGPVQYGQHLGVDIDTTTGYFYAPMDKLHRLARKAKQLLHRAARDARWLPVRVLQSLAGWAQYVFSAIPAARFYLRELHDVVGSKWGGRVRMTHPLLCDLEWWTAVPTQANGRPIHRPVETAYMQCDSSGYGWGAVLNGMLEARGFRGAAGERQHITCKELKAVRLAVESFLPHLADALAFGQEGVSGSNTHDSAQKAPATERWATSERTAMASGSQPTQTDVEQSGAGLGEPLATIHEDEHGQEEEEEEEEEKEEEEEEGPITVGGVREWHNDYEMRRGIQQIKNKRFTKSTNTCQPCQGSSAPRTVLVDNRYYQVVAATR
eukprot:jgi/Tetstr1/435923/TSEL_002659.t1